MLSRSPDRELAVIHAALTIARQTDGPRRYHPSLPSSVALAAATERALEVAQAAIERAERMGYAGRVYEAKRVLARKRKDARLSGLVERMESAFCAGEATVDAVLRAFKERWSRGMRFAAQSLPTLRGAIDELDARALQELDPAAVLSVGRVLENAVAADPRNARKVLALLARDPRLLEPEGSAPRREWEREVSPWFPDPRACAKVFARDARLRGYVTTAASSDGRLLLGCFSAPST